MPIQVYSQVSNSDRICKNIKKAGEYQEQFDVKALSACFHPNEASNLNSFKSCIGLGWYQIDSFACFSFEGSRNDTTFHVYTFLNNCNFTNQILIYPVEIREEFKDTWRERISICNVGQYYDMKSFMIIVPIYPAFDIVKFNESLSSHPKWRFPIGIAMTRVDTLFVYPKQR